MEFEKIDTTNLPLFLWIHVAFLNGSGKGNTSEGEKWCDGDIVKWGGDPT